MKVSLFLLKWVVVFLVISTALGIVVGMVTLGGYIHNHFGEIGLGIFVLLFVSALIAACLDYE